MSTASERGHLRGVSLGPGAPDLITVRALDALRSSDIIYYPIARGHSRCLAVLEHYGVADKARPFEVEMQDREAAENSYEAVRKALRADLDGGAGVAVVCEGCVSLYSTVFRALGCGDFNGVLELIPGVSSPSAAAAAAGVCLGLGEGGVALVAGSSGAKKIEESVERFESVVVLKPSRDIVSLIKEKGWEFVFCRDVGGEKHLVTDDESEITDVQYFSLFIISRVLNKCWGA